MGASFSAKRGSLSEGGGVTLQKTMREQVEEYGARFYDEGESRPQLKKDTSSMDKPRSGKVAHAIRKILRLQIEASATQIDGRENRRKVLSKLQDVWFWDGKFMGEVQRLLADGKLSDFQQLTRLANECQNAREILKPIEQENIEAEQRWESQIYRLQQAERSLLADFEEEFQDDETYSMTSTGSSSEHLEPSADYSGQQESVINMSDINHATRSITSSSRSHFHMLPPSNLSIPAEDAIMRDAILSDLITFDTIPADFNDYAIDCDSGVEDIDGRLERPPYPGSTGPAISLPKRDYMRLTSLEFYPQLLTDFACGRDRINKWLENTSLQSRLEGLSVFTILKTQLEADNQAIPSNWAQLVIAFWELDEAARPKAHGQQED